MSFSVRTENRPLSFAPSFLNKKHANLHRFACHSESNIQLWGIRAQQTGERKQIPLFTATTPFYLIIACRQTNVNIFIFRHSFFTKS